MGEWLGLPAAASEHAHEIDELILTVHAVMVSAFILWGIAFLLPLFRRKRPHSAERRYNGIRGWWPFIPVVAISLIELALLIGVALPFWDRRVVAAPVITDETTVVRVVGQQFQWNIHYPGEDGIFGETDPALIDDQTNPVGLNLDDPYAQDDITTLNDLHLPVDRPAVIYLSTKDMIHSFNLPEMRVKQDIIPGMRIPVSFTPTVTTEEFGRRFEIACAQLCGLGHYRMRGFITVEPLARYNSWLAEQRARIEAERQSSWLDDL